MSIQIITNKKKDFISGLKKNYPEKYQKFLDDDGIRCFIDLLERNLIDFDSSLIIRVTFILKVQLPGHDKSMKGIYWHIIEGDFELYLHLLEFVAFEHDNIKISLFDTVNLINNHSDKIYKLDQNEYAPLYVLKKFYNLTYAKRHFIAYPSESAFNFYDKILRETKDSIDKLSLNHNVNHN